MTAQNFETLRARVQALGYELIVSDKGEQFVIEARDRDHTVEVLFIHRNDDDDDLEGWLADQETVSERVREGARGLAPAEGDADDQFLGLLVIAGMSDRFKAMEIRRDKGVEAAIAFLGDCKLSNETAPGDARNSNVMVFRRIAAPTATGTP